MIGNHIELSDGLVEFLDGLLLGDGCLSSRRDVSAYYQHRDKHQDYIQWLIRGLSDFRLNLAGKIHKQGNGRGGFTYYFKTKEYRELKKVYDRWYPDREKKIPNDIAFSPSTLMNWYVGDGTRKKDGSVYLLVIQERMRKNLPLVVEKLEDIGMECTINSMGVRIRNKSSDRFFEYIQSNGNEIPPCYQYKFLGDELKWLEQVNRR